METDSNTLPIFIDTCDLETKALDQCGNQSKDFITKSKLLKASILKNVKTLHHILSEIQPYKVTTFEIEHSVKTLDMININAGFFYKKVDYISVFMPSNLPLYSFILFGIVPSFMTNKKLFIKPNQLMREKGIFAKVCAILNVQQLFKNVEIINHETSKFINEYVPASDVIIFTGYNKNRDKILSLIKPGSLLIYNGSGHNPFVIGRNANIEKAAKDACYAKFFNSGQDCAGPDAILVHESIFHDFMQMYLMEVEKLKIGKYDDQNVDVGPITRKSELQKFLDLLHANDADNVKIGGVIDMRNKIVSPTIIATHLSDVNNYEEVFGPISFVYCYNDDDDVSLYFNDKNGTYMRNKMYVSLYGENHYVSLRDDSKMSARNGIGIVLYNKNVHDFEEGHKAYGGYSLGASGVFFKNDENNLTSKALPIYIPEIIALHADQKIFNKIRKFKKPKKESMSNIVEPFHAKTIETFGDNLIFGFIFGSYAKGKARFSGKNASDLDVFICLKERNNYQESLFKKFIVKFQWENGLKPDLDYCCEIISFSELEISMCRLHKNPIQIYFNDESTFDAIIYLCALAGPKAAVIGNKTMLSNLTSQANNEVKRQSDLFIQSIEKCGLINRKILLQNNNGLIHRNDVLNFLKSCFKRGEYGDIIREFIPMGGEKILITQDDVNYNKTAFYKKCEQTQVFV